MLLYLAMEVAGWCW